MNDAPAPAARAWTLALLPDRLAARLAALTGWRCRATAFFLGATATLALPPVSFLPVYYLAFPALVWMIGGARSRRDAFWLGWWFGFGWFAASLYWIGNALLVFSDRTAWMVPFAVLGLPAFLAVFTGAAGAVASAGRTHLERALWLAAAWTAAEWLRGHILTGFPWNLAGHGWLGSAALMQSAAFAGVYGMSFAAVLSAALPAALAQQDRKTRFGAGLAALLILALPWAGGAVRLGGAPAVGESVQPEGGMRIVQAAIPQREKWKSDRREKNLLLNLRLSVENRPDWVKHVIWGENAATFFVEEQPAYREAMARAIPLGGLLITGAPRRTAGPLRIWNSVVALDVHGAVVGHYDKSHLVPFGEYAPFRDYLPIDKIAHGAVDYSAGDGPRTLQLDGLPAVSPLICYEAIFPGAVVDRSRRPAWLLNLTNDAWYGVTAGPHQHLAISSLRAVEEGLPLVRAANTGISAVVDAYGREIGRIGLAQQGVLDFRLPKPIAEPTPYGRFGDWIFAIILAVFSAGLVVLRMR
ncbi:MAG: apolipoprotein N-acyltransferase [Alphaproteobacteria bacterium]|nr:apolipoprotein N-acyltransferase [Alphaproteobacteria bacterium]